VSLVKEREGKLCEILAHYGLKGKNFSDDMRLVIDEIHKLLIIDKRSQAQELQESESKPFHCLNRIFISEHEAKRKKGYWCVDKPPRMVKLYSKEICKVCKARKVGLNERTLVNLSEIAAPMTLCQKVEAQFSTNLQSQLSFEDKGNYIEVKPKSFLGHETFGKISRIVLKLDGEYFSQGTNSHFRIFKKNTQGKPLNL